MGFIKMVISGDIVELYEFTKEINQKVKFSRQKRHPLPVGVSYQRRVENVRRSRKNFVRLIYTNLARADKPSLFTLTFVQKLSLLRCVDLLGEYIRLLRKVLKCKISYIAVPEFQKRGVVHFHLLVWGLPVKYVENEKHNRTLQHLWARGFVDIRITDGSSKLAGYLAKYMLKAVFDVRLAGQKAYYTSRDIVRPLLLNTKTSVSFAREAVGVTVDKLVYFKKFDTMWLGECSYSRYKLK